MTEQEVATLNASTTRNWRQQKFNIIGMTPYHQNRFRQEQITMASHYKARQRQLLSLYKAQQRQLGMTTTT